MVKDNDTVIKEFNELVNMTTEELKEWLKERRHPENMLPAVSTRSLATDESINTGWTKSDGSGESVGHESGRRIVEILMKNPNRDPSLYDDEDLAHMRKVVGYCKRHLAQEEATAKRDTSSKSYRSLKNWGHDVLKT